jgi:hypothetical protein
MVVGFLVIDFQLKSKPVPREILGIKMEIIPQVQLLTEVNQFGMVDFVISQSGIKKKTISPTYSQDDRSPLRCKRMGRKDGKEQEYEIQRNAERSFLLVFHPLSNINYNPITIVFQKYALVASIPISVMELWL